MNPTSLQIRLVQDSDIPRLRQLVNDAYKELADMGLNYTATYQDEKITRERVSQGRAFALVHENEIIATVLFFEKNYFTNKKTAYVGQLAVDPRFKKQGLGKVLMDHCEKLAREENFQGLQLDTAKPAEHLVKWYLSRGYEIIGEQHWEGKTYDSYIFQLDFNQPKFLEKEF